MSAKKRTQVKLAGKIGICPLHLSEVKRSVANLGAKAARKAAKVTGTDVSIWMDGASASDKKARIDAINKWCKGE